MNELVKEIFVPKNGELNEITVALCCLGIGCAGTFFLYCACLIGKDVLFFCLDLVAGCRFRLLTPNEIEIIECGDPRIRKALAKLEESPCQQSECREAHRILEGDDA